MKRVEPEVSGVHVGGDDPWQPCLVFPLPAGYGGWVEFRGGEYIAFISRRTPPEKFWQRTVGARRSDLSAVWWQISSFFGEVLSAEEAHFVKTRPGVVPATSRTAPARVPSFENSGTTTAEYKLDKLNYPQSPSPELFNDIRLLLSGMFEPGSDPTVDIGVNGPKLTLSAHSMERLVFFGIFNSLFVLHFKADSRGEPYLYSGPEALSCEFVHEAVSAALIIGAAFLAALEEARDDVANSLALRAALESESATARLIGADWFNTLVANVENGVATPLQRRGRWAMEALRVEYS